MKEFTRQKRGDSNWAEFEDYLEKLAKVDNKPFNCPLLAILPEPVQFKTNTYPTGSLMCAGNTDSSPTCRLMKEDIKLNNQGQLEVHCSWNGSKFVLSIVSFEPRKPRLISQ